MCVFLAAGTLCGSTKLPHTGSFRERDIHCQASKWHHLAPGIWKSAVQQYSETAVAAVGKLYQVTCDELCATKLGQLAFGPIRRIEAAAYSAFADDSFVSAFITLSGADLSTSINRVLLLCFSSDNLVTSFCFDSAKFAILRSFYCGVFVDLPLFRQRETGEF